MIFKTVKCLLKLIKDFISTVKQTFPNAFLWFKKNYLLSLKYPVSAKSLVWSEG